MFGLMAEGFWSAFATRAFTGMGWAGTYMTGLKLLADRVDAKTMSRATAAHAAGQVVPKRADCTGPLQREVPHIECGLIGLARPRNALRGRGISAWAENCKQAAFVCVVPSDRVACSFLPGRGGQHNLGQRVALAISSIQKGKCRDHRVPRREPRGKLERGVAGAGKLQTRNVGGAEIAIHGTAHGSH